MQERLFYVKNVEEGREEMEKNKNKSVKPRQLSYTKRLREFNSDSFH